LNKTLVIAHSFTFHIYTDNSGEQNTLIFHGRY